MRARTLALAPVLLSVLAGACREAPEAATAPERTPAAVAYPLRLTYSLRDDRTPGWSPDGDSVYYVHGTGAALGVPTTRGMVLPSDAGLAEPTLEEVQPAPGQPLLLFAPTFSRAGDRLAFVQVTGYHPAEVGFGSAVCTGDPRAIEGATRGPRLAAMRVHVRSPATGAARSVEVELPGRFFDTSEDPGFGLTGVMRVRYWPFQRNWESERAVPFHLSWSPDGQRVATSDGVSVLVWDVDAGLPQILSGTRDGVAPAWSPEGQRIAFTRLTRADSASARCQHWPPMAFTPSLVQDRRIYFEGPRQLAVVEIATGAVTELGLGEEPAWSRDGRFVYARRDDAIWRIPLDGGAATMLPDTKGGREPAVSPDGNLLTYSLLNARGDYDVWITRLPER